MKSNSIVIKSVFVLLLVLFGLISVNAQDVNIDGLKYHLFPETHEAALIDGNKWSGELDIPSEVTYNGELFVVNGMIWFAFKDCTELTKVRIPKTIDHIIHHVLSDDDRTGAVSPDYMNPFLRCSSLESIVVDEENPSMSSDDGILFNKDKTQLYCYPAGKQQEEYVIPENVTWVGPDAICYNNYLSSLTIPNSVTYCGGICNNCKNMKTVRLSENITYIPAYSFDKCESLRFLDIPESVQGFGESVFRWTHIEKMVIRGTFPNGLRNDTFAIMDNATILYVQQAEIENFKKVFHGTVLPLEKYTSGIDQIKIHQPSAIVYDLQGRRLTGEPGKGIYIQNGRKVIAK